MSKQDKKGLVPALRFPEFRDAGEWNEKVISKLGKTVNGLNGKKGEDFGSGEPFVQYKQVFDKSYIDFSKCGKVKIERGENQNRLQKGDILFTTSSETQGEVGFASVVVSQPDKDTYLNSFCFILRPYNIEEILLDFSRYLFHCPIYRKSVTKIAQGSTRFNLSKDAFLRLKLPIPLPKEQQKIADCLSSLDALITAHTQKHQALQSYKKGLMQNLFPAKADDCMDAGGRETQDAKADDCMDAGGRETQDAKADDCMDAGGRETQDAKAETVPALRFPEFRDAGEWEEVTLGSICDYWNGSSHEGSVSKNGHYYLISLNSIDIDGNLKPDMKRLSFTDESLQKGDLVMVLSDVAHGNFLGLTDIIPDEYYVLNQRMAGLRQKDGNSSDARFLRYFINANQQYFKSNGQGSSQLNLSKYSVTEFPVAFPCIKEQQKIADCLSSVDDLITAQAEKIEGLKTHKKGLMQQLFPATDDDCMDAKAGVSA